MRNRQVSRGYLVRCGKCGSERNVGDTNEDNYWNRVCKSYYWDQCQKLSNEPNTVRLHWRKNGETFWGTDAQAATDAARPAV